MFYVRLEIEIVVEAIRELKLICVDSLVLNEVDLFVIIYIF